MDRSQRQRNYTFDSEYASAPIWYWQSDPDPFKIKDPEKQSWTAYSESDSLKIEKAYMTRAKEVQLDNYVIHFAEMIYQSNKNDPSKIRLVKRLLDDGSDHRLMAELPKPTQVTKEKTYNKAFGNVDHFLSFLMMRTLESYNIYLILDKLELSAKQKDFQKAVDAVCDCIMEAGQTREQVLSTRVQNLQVVTYVQQAQILVNEINHKQRSLKEFLRLIIKIYTMETFVCYWLNELLRLESWEKMNIMTPYLVCLTYAFKLGEKIFTKPNVIKSLFLPKPKSLFNITLYRGVALFQDHIDLYNPDNQASRFFSWNSVTSTTRSKQIATDFMRRSINKSKTQKQEKIGVLFEIIIEDAIHEGVLDIARFSANPQEEEVVLAPATVFQMVYFMKKDDYYEITLKMKNKLKSKKDNSELLGELQKKIVSKTEAVIENLDDEKIVQSLLLLTGSKMIKSFKIFKCLLNEHLITMIKTTSETFSSLEDLDFELDNETIPNNSLVELAKAVENNLKNTNNRTLKKKLTLKYVWNNSNNDLELLASEWENLSSLNITVHIQCNLIKDDLIIEFCKSLKNLLQISSLILTFNGCTLLTDKGINDLIATVSLIQTLKNLTIKFSHSIHGNGHPNLDSFSFITDQSLQDLSKLLDSVPKLEQLNLVFFGCRLITSAGFKSLVNSIRNLKSLHSLSLCFERCDEIDDKVLKILSDSIKDSKMTKLILNFDSCKKVTDAGLKEIADSMKFMTSLNTLGLIFNYCTSITPFGFAEVAKSIYCFCSLKELILDFFCISLRSDSIMQKFSESLSTLVGLQSLRLNFNFCSIDDDMFGSIFKTLSSMTGLNSLTLNFDGSFSLKDKGVNILTSSLKKLKSLQKLELGFEYCFLIKRKAIVELFKAIESLLALTNLSLRFTGSSEVTDSDLINLALDFEEMPNLTYLNLFFDKCYQITEDGIKSLTEILQDIGTIFHMNLSFQDCNKIKYDLKDEIDKSEIHDRCRIES